MENAKATTRESGKDEDEDKDDDDKDDDDDDDDDMGEEDADVRNFMKNHMENLEDEEEDEDEDDEPGAEGDSDQTGTEVAGGSRSGDAPKEKRSLSTDNSSTIFVRNLPFSATDEALKSHFSAFGAVRYARIVMDRLTDRPAGMGFVCFFNVDDLTSCLKSSPRQKTNSTLKKQSILQDDTVDRDGRYTMDGRVLQVTQAVSKEEAGRLATEGSAARRGQEKDRRRLFLLSEGTISTSSPLYSTLPPAEVKMREASAKQRKKLVEGNPSLHVSLTPPSAPEHSDEHGFQGAQGASAGGPWSGLPRT